MSHVNFLYHIVCTTKERRRLISPDWESELFGLIGVIVLGSKGKLIEINGIEGHLHMLLRLGPTIAFSDFMRGIRSESSGFVRREFEPRFINWQRRYGAFTVSESAVPAVRKYIRNQNWICGGILDSVEVKTTSNSMSGTFGNSSTGPETRVSHAKRA